MMPSESPTFFHIFMSNYFFQSLRIALSRSQNIGLTANRQSDSRQLACRRLTDKDRLDGSVPHLMKCGSMDTDTETEIRESGRERHWLRSLWMRWQGPIEKRPTYWL